MTEGTSISSTCGKLAEEAKSYQFFGRHLFASYYDCDDTALGDHKELVNHMMQAVQATGATLLRYVEHEFFPQGYAAVMLLAESHASIHTYPEHKACFVDIFTCGDMEIELFDQRLQEYLKPGGCSKKIFCRTRVIEEELTPLSATV